MEKKMKSYHQKFVSDHPYESSPMAEIAGFPVRPGIYDLNGATPLQNGVNFTIHTCGGTSCELLLFHRAQEEPFAVLPFPEAYKIGDVYSMIVYGLNIDELVLEEPEMVKQGSRFGVKLRATAPSIHMIRANIETEVSPIVGSEKQSEELVNYLLSGFENDPTSIWESNIFGKSLHELVNEGLQAKLAKMPEEAQFKLQETLERIVNEGSGGLICIIL